MEVFLLLIDEVEDAAYTLVHCWSRLCRGCLVIGLLDAVLLLFSRFVVMDLDWIMILTAVATGCVALWCVSLLSSVVGNFRESISVA